MKYVIAYDLGTGGTKASLYDENGQSMASSFVSCDTFFPQDGYHEQSPKQWWDIVKESTKKLINQVHINLEDIECIGVSGHSLGVVPINEKGKLLIEKVPIWSDSRAVEEAKDFFDKVDAEYWYMTTGNGFPPQLYSIFKIMWYKKKMPEIYEETYKFLGTKDYINYCLTGVAATDYSYASGSGVYDLKGWKYHDEFINSSGIAADKLPDMYSSEFILGSLDEKVSKELGLPKSVKVVCGGVDNACMALGAGCIHEGMSYTSLGTSAWIAVASHDPIVEINKKPYVFTHCIPGMYVSATAIFSAGNSYRWVKDNICINLKEQERTSGNDAYVQMNKLAQSSSLGANKLLFNPSLAGGSSLDKSVNIRGAFIGLTLGHTQADLIRATLEGICLNLKLALDVLRKSVDLSEDMLIVGGGGKSSFWRKLFADIYNMNIIKTNVGQDAGSLGAAAIAFVGSGLWDDYEKISIIHQIEEKIEPDQSNVIEYKKVLEVFEKISEVQSDIGDMLYKL